MLNNQSARRAVAGVIEPVARKLLAIGLTPDAVTYIGAAGTSVAALWFFPRGQFVAGVLVILLFVFSDLMDGTMARLSGRAGPWGNYLDSTLDRVADGAVFGGVLIYFALNGEDLATAAAWVCLVGGFVVSYARARAESLGADASVGIAERAERLIVVLVAAFVQGLGVPWILEAAVIVLAILTLVTVAQRFTHVRRQLVSTAPPPAAAPESGSAPGPAGAPPAGPPEPYPPPEPGAGRYPPAPGPGPFPPGPGPGPVPPPGGGG